MNTNTNTNTISKRLSGYIKWFNNKKGFGFITVSSEGDYLNGDIFIHFSAIRSNGVPYTYLVQGEYVEFNISNVTNNNHSVQACDVSGINGGHIMCQYQPQKKVEDVSVQNVPVVDTNRKRQRIN